LYSALLFVIMLWRSKPKQRNNMWRLLKYMKPHWRRFLAAMLCGEIKVLTPTAIAWLTGKVINTLQDVIQGNISHLVAWHRIEHFVLIGIGIMIIGAPPVYLRSSLAARAVQEVTRSLRLDLYAHIQKLSHSFFDANRSGSLTSRIMGDVEAVQPFIDKAFIQIWMGIGQLFFIIPFFLSSSVPLTFVAVAVVPFQILIQRKIGWRVQKNARDIRDQLAMLSGSAQEKLAAATIVKAFTGEDDEIQRFDESATNLVELGVRNSKLGGISGACMSSAKLLGQLVLVLVGSYLALSQGSHIKIGTLVTFVLMQNQIFWPIDVLNEMQLVVAAAMGATERIFAIFDTEPEIADRPGATRAPKFTGEVVFDHVTFTYPTSTKPVFTNLNLTAPARSTLALVGTSGGGKSTVTNLLNRFYDWETGRILIDGTDIRDYTIYSLRSQIGLVPQEPILFSGTIEDNILYGRPDASPDEVREAARRAYATDFIEETDDGFDTMLGERGVRLSGGQKQRISIARAFLKDPAIIILDEATSALDSESELIVQQAIEELMRDRTTIVIAHRLSTIRQADQIAVIDDGGVAELGCHEDLLRQDGLYAKLSRQQFELLPEA
jgi:ATP-binding cassette, subfamily B, putative efflux pump